MFNASCSYACVYGTQQAVSSLGIGEAAGSYKHPDNTLAQVTRYTSDYTMSMCDP